MNPITMTSSRKYLYDFDVPTASSFGSVEIFVNKIVVIFPETQDSQVCHQNVSLYVNHQLNFSNQWMPMSSYHDFYKLKDMLTLCYLEFLTKSNYYSHFEHHGYKPGYYTNLVTTFDNEWVSIQCFEDMYNTCLEINCKPPMTTTTTTNENNIVDIEIYIGSHKIISGHDIYKNLNSVDQYNFVMDVILNKIIKFY